MVTQSRNIIDPDDLAALQREYGINVGGAMAAAVEETKDAVVSVATNVVNGTAGLFSFIDRGGAYFIAGVIVGMILTVIARII